MKGVKLTVGYSACSIDVDAGATKKMVKQKRSKVNTVMTSRCKRHSTSSVDRMIKQRCTHTTKRKRPSFLTAAELLQLGLQVAAGVTTAGAQQCCCLSPCLLQGCLLHCQLCL